MQLHERFEWDDTKERSNIEKHGLGFDAAARVLADPAGDFHHYEEPDEAHGAGEDRYRTVATYPEDRGLVLTIVWTERQDDEGLLTRIISARLASRKERKKYAEYIQQKHGA